jgi:predicted nucleic acid-binding protein
MKAVFADTSFWIALTNEGDAAYEKAQAFSLSLGSRKIITSESVLTEYLNYFAGWGPYFRNQASANARALLLNRMVDVERSQATGTSSRKDSGRCSGLDLPLQNPAARNRSNVASMSTTGH